MAEIKRVTRSAPISSFRQVAPSGGGMFAAIADLAETAYDAIAPGVQKMREEESAAHHRELARQAIAQNRPVSLAASTKGPLSYRDAIASIESAGSGDYAAVGPTHDTLGRALGRYQIMEANIGPWSREALGREVGADEFLASPEIQDAIFDHRFGQYVQQFGEEGAAQAWFAGPGGVGKIGRTDSLGTSVGDYTAKFRTAIGGERLSTQSVTVQTSEGRLEPRLYSPLAGPMLQAANAAGMAAYNAEILNQSAVDLFDLSNQFPLDPDGFSGAAKGYIDQIVKGAPRQFQEALRGQMETAVQRRFLGMVEERHRDTRQRAINSTGALADRYQTELAEAIASGDEAAIGAAAANLDDVLGMRESLPGLAWTPAQSDNVRIAARDAAERLRASRIKEAADELKGQLETAILAQENGMTSQYDMLAADPTVQALHPELARELGAWTLFNQTFPNFATGTADERKSVIAELRAIPVTSDADVAIVKAAEKRHEQITTDWHEDPIAAAEKYLPVKPPAVPPPDDPRFTQSLNARARYSEWLVETGRVTEPAIFSDAEAKMLTTALAATTPAEMRMATAAQLVAGLGEHGVRGFKELGQADPVIRYAGMMMARGGDPGIAIEALSGQVLLAENQAQLPPKADRIQSFDANIAAAIAVLPDAARVQTDVMAFAQAIYASRARGMDPNSEAAMEVMKGAVQSALGQTEHRGRLLGGVQEVGGHQVLLPPNVAGVELDEALRRATGAPVGRMEGFLSGMVGGWTETMGGAWEAATAIEGQPPSVPYAAGAPLPRDAVANDQVRFIPVRGNLYRMVVVGQFGAGTPVEASDGKTLLVDVQKLIQATR